jgi:hypothetical protein
MIGNIAALLGRPKSWGLIGVCPQLAAVIVKRASQRSLQILLFLAERIILFDLAIRQAFTNGATRIATHRFRARL